MTKLTATVETLLAIDVGTVTTRAALFEIVEGRYRFVAAGVAQSTATAPFKNILEGVHMALTDLQGMTGRRLIGNDQQIIMPAHSDGSGVDKCIATLSAGPPLKIVAVGLLEDISLQSVQNLVNTTYAQVSSALSLNDRRTTATRLDTVQRLKPDMIVISGGTDGGASQSVLSLLEPIGLACYLMPKEQRPEILYAGNAALAQDVKTELAPVAPVQIAPNIRPALEVEQLLPAHKILSDTYRRTRGRTLPGVRELDIWSGGFLMPTAAAFARMMRLISKELAPKQRGVLGVDVGAGATTLAAGFAGEQFLNVHTNLGLGASLFGLLKYCTAADIARWVDEPVSEEDIRSYVYNKALYPASLPVTPEELALEYALTSQLISTAIKLSNWNLPAKMTGSIPGFLPAFESIIASGGVFSNAPTRGRVLLTLLNALQPVGWTTLVLDQNQVAAMLGAAADVAPLLTVQALRDSSSFMNLGMVIAPVGKANPGTPVLRLQVKYGDGSETAIEVKYGNIETIPLPPGQTATLRLQPLHRFDIGMGAPGRGGTVKNITGSDSGLIIDARGRPLIMPADAGARRDQLKKWLAALGN
jgi:hypothetical protein